MASGLHHHVSDPRAYVDDVGLVQLVLDSSGWVRSTNAAGGRLRGWHGGPVRWLQDLTHSTGRFEVTRLLETALTQGRSAGEIQVRARLAPVNHLELLVSQIDHRRGDSAARRDLLVRGWDITVLVNRREELGISSLRDPLTGVATRIAFLNQLDHHLTRSADLDHRLAVVQIAVDVRASTRSARDGGNRVLTGVAASLMPVLRPGDLIARVAVDEFAVLFPGLPGRPALNRLLDRLHAVTARPIRDAGGTLQPVVSIGATFADELTADSRTATSLLARTDHRRLLDLDYARPAARGPVT